MYVDVLPRHCLRIDAETFGMAFEILEGYDRRFLSHDVAEIACEGQNLTFPFDRADSTNRISPPYLSPCEAGNYPRSVIVLVFFRIDFWRAEKAAHIVCRDCEREILSGGLEPCYLAKHARYGFVELAYSGLTGVPVYEVTHGFRGERYFILFEAVFFQLARQKMAYGDLFLFIGNVTADVDQFHTVEQRAGY